MGDRDDMLVEIVADYRRTARQTGLAEPDPRVLEALRTVPRQRFVPPDLLPQAYDNHALSIGLGQTISQPYIVALMSDLLEIVPGCRVLEIGTGSGYQAAVLAELGARLWSVELLPALAEGATVLLVELGYGSVSIRVGDGHLGWPEHGPFERIIVTAAARELPMALLDQLAPGGRMLIPLDVGFDSQMLTLITKDAAGETTRRGVLAVRFVPLRRG